MLRRHLPLAALTLVPRVGSAAQPFSFVVPEAFVDITHQTKPPLSPIDDSFYDAARSMDLMAVRLLDGRVVAICGAKVSDGESAPTDLSKVVEEARLKLPSGTSLEVLSTKQVTLGGVHCGRLEMLRKTSEGTARSLTFVLPGGGSWAQLDLLVFDVAHFDESAAAFEAAVAQTSGIATRRNAMPSSSSSSAASSSQLGQLGLVLLLAAVFGAVMRGRRRGAARRPPSDG